MFRIRIQLCQEARSGSSNNKGEQVESHLIKIIYSNLIRRLVELLLKQPLMLQVPVYLHFNKVSSIFNDIANEMKLRRF